MVKALYPGSFDPVTNGHMDIVTRASQLFEQVVVSVYDLPLKSVLFSTEERVELFSRAVKGLPNVEVIHFSGLMVRFAQQLGVQVVVRGLRAGADFENEFEMFLMNRKLAPTLEAVYMMSRLDWQFLSSARVKEVVQLGADVGDLVPPHVVDALRAKLQISAPSGR